MLLEREAELAALDELMARAASGRGGCVVVEGPAGIGKTSILAQAMEGCADLLVLHGLGGELEREHGYGVCRQLLSTTARRRPELLAGAASAAAAPLGLGGGGADEEEATFSALYWLCVALLDERGLLIVVDDVQWADPESLRWLAYLVRRASDLPLGIVLGLRTGERGEHLVALDAIRRIPSTTAVSLRPLSVAAVRTLAGDAGEFAAAVHEAAGGNPFYTRSLIEEAARAGVEHDAEGARTVAALSPPAIEGALLVRLAQTGPAARALAEAVAVLGLGAPVNQAGELAGLQPAVAEQAADDLAHAGILHRARPLDFVHPVLRQAVIADIPPGQLSARHREAARLLAAHDAPAESVASHLMAVAPAGDEWVASALAGAAERAEAAGSPQAAARYLERALLEPAPQGSRRGILTALAEAQSRQGRLDVAVANYVLAFHAAAGDVPARLGIVERLTGIGLVRHADRVLPELCRTVIDEIDESTRSSHAAALVQVYLLSHEPTFERRFAGIEELLGQLPEDSPGAHVARLAWANWGVINGRVPAAEGLAVARELMGIGAHGGNEEMHNSNVWLLSQLGDFDLAQQYCERAMERAREGGRERPYREALALLAKIRLAAGALDEAESGLREALAGSEHVSQVSPLWVAGTRYCLVEALIARGDVDGAARAHVPVEVEDDERIRHWVEQEVRFATVLLDLAGGRPNEAADAVLEIGERMRETDTDGPLYSNWRALGAEALAAAGRDDEARAIGDEDVRLSRAAGVPHVLARALTAAARVRPADEAKAMLEEAVAAASASEARYVRARALFEHGAVLRRQGERVRARERLREALDAATTCRADGLAARAHDELRASGGRLRRERLSGVDSLTPSELRVAELAAGGATNREICQSLFLSPKTVEMHLGRTYRKLDIPGRAGLADALSGAGAGR